MNLTKLNTDCFLEIFANLPIAKQLQHRLVNTGWCDIIEDGLRRRKSLAIVRKWNRNWDTYQHKFGRPLVLANEFGGEPLIETLVRLMPNIQTLLSYVDHLKKTI